MNRWPPGCPAWWSRSLVKVDVLQDSILNWPNHQTRPVFEHQLDPTATWKSDLLATTCQAAWAFSWCGNWRLGVEPSWAGTMALPLGEKNAAKTRWSGSRWRERASWSLDLWGTELVSSGMFKMFWHAPPLCPCYILVLPISGLTAVNLRLRRSWATGNGWGALRTAERSDFGCDSALSRRSNRNLQCA